MNQQTVAAKAAMGMIRGRGAKRRKATRTKRRAKSSTGTRRKKRSGKPARLVKGSAAAKAYMAKIRRKRKR
jgi:hypothetical protein